MVIGISLASDILQELDYLLEPSIGPCGKEVLLKSNTGTLFSTSNGCSILRHLNFSHPVGTMIKSSADKFILKYGDSSKSFIIFLSGLIRSFCKLLQNCLKKVEMLSDVSQFLLKMRELYSFEIMRTSSYNEGLLLVLPANDLPSNFLRGIFDSFMSGKFNCETKEFLFGICQGIIDSFQFSRTSLRFLVDNFDNICIPLCGISFTQSQCLEGVIVQKESFPKQVNISECFFILISGKLKRSKLNSFETCLNEKFTVEMREAEKYTFFQQLVSTLKENNIRLIFFEEQVPKSFQMLLELSDIVYVPYTQSCDLKRLAMLYKISVISGLYDIFNIDNKTCIVSAFSIMQYDSMDYGVGKKLVNDPLTCVADSLEGFVLSNAGVKLLKGTHIVVREDLNIFKKQKKVSLIAGGGSGHEPAHIGYIGKGMLTAAVCGDIFASPSSLAILSAIRACANDAGVLLIVKNYTGDRLHFGRAVELAKSEGINVEMIVVGEDCAILSEDKNAGRRGLCGTILIHKIAGAMAEEGKTIDEIHKFLQDSILAMGTISVSLSSCSIPGKPCNFVVGKDVVEFGLGVKHNDSFLVKGLKLRKHSYTEVSTNENNTAVAAANFKYHQPGGVRKVAAPTL
uniref:Bifunctional ATP-dependent dihydroxyacetone kinase/FAD-AMP lyase (Cyclizing) n=1 Tax=Hydra vulgaris TaxID=6087 RepID=T2MCB6_HYDVU